VVRIKALEEQIPKSDQRVKEAFVEALRFESGQFAQGLKGQELDKEDQELGRGERGRGGFWVKGVFLDGVMYAYTIVCIRYMLYYLL